MISMTDLELYTRFCELITDNKRLLFERIAQLRTRHVTVVLEDIYQSQNASAVVRTADLTGIQQIHVIEDRNKYQIDRGVTLGSSKWIDIARYQGTAECVNGLRREGYRIIATSPRARNVTPENVDISRPMAFCFGTELTGLSDTMLDMADEHMSIPMYGFTESFNISASAAIVLYTVMQRLRSSDVEWRPSDADQVALKLRWIKKVVHDPDLLEAHFRTSGG